MTCVCNESFEMLQNSIGEVFAAQVVTGIAYGKLTAVYNLGVDSTDPEHQKHRMYAIELNDYFFIPNDAILKMILIKPEEEEDN